MNKRTALALYLTLPFALPVDAACPSDREAASIAARYANLEPSPNPPSDLSMGDAACGRDKYVAMRAQQYGKVIGYKAGLTNPAVAKRFNADKPVRGVLLEKMMLRDGVEVPAKFGVRPVFEADMILEVKDAGVNNAKSPLEVLRHISRIYPFIELPDFTVEDPTKLTAPGLTLINVAARYGVLGKPVEVKATQALADALAAMTVKLVDQDGKELDSSKGTVVLDHPLNAVSWLASDLAAEGKRLEKGMLLSLGSFSRLLPPKPGMQVTAIYEGLPGNPQVTVRFK